MMPLLSIVPPFFIEDRLNLGDALKLNLGVLGERLHLLSKGLKMVAKALKFSFQHLKFGARG